MAKKRISIEIVGEITKERISQYITDVTLAYSLVAQDKMSSNKPAGVEPGSMQWVSDKQRKYVMGAITRGEMKIPYLRGRGNGIEGSKELNNSYRRDLQGSEVVMYSTAPYSKYVVGTMQYWMHKGRWKNAEQVAQEMHDEGIIDYVARKLMKDF